MAFSILVIILVGVVAFFHYVQGFFSATLSAFIAIIAAVLAVSYHETVVLLLLKGHMADYAHGMVLCGIFAITYTILRTIFDSFVPGNVRTPMIVDKVGAGLMGLVAGTFSVGIFAIAVQMMPWDPAMSYMGYSRYALASRPHVIIPSGGGRQDIDSHIDNEMVEASMDPDKQTKLLLPVDDIVMATVYHLSDGGSLAGDRPMAAVHPDYLQELYGERLGDQTGERRTALYLNGNDPLDVRAVFTAPSLPAFDAEVAKLRPDGNVVKPELKPGPGQQILIVRCNISSSATDDEDSIFRFSPGSVHLVGPQRDGSFKDYYPVGMLENGNTALIDRADDFLFMKAGDSFDAIFVVDSSVVTNGKLAAGTLISVKRFGLADLSGETVKTTITADPSVKLIRPQSLIDALKLPPPSATPAAAQPATPAPTVTAAPNPPAVTPATPAPADNAAQPAANKPIGDDVSAIANSGFMAPGSISLGTSVADQEAKDAPVAGGKISLTGGQISAATIDPTETLTKLAEGTSAYNQFFTPQGRTMVQVQVTPYTRSWEWMQNYGTVAVVDSNGNKYPASGVYALAKNGDGHGLLLRFDASKGVSVASPSGDPDSNLYFIFLIPSDTELKSFTMGGKTQDLSSPLKVQ